MVSSFDGAPHSIKKSSYAGISLPTIEQISEIQDQARQEGYNACPACAQIDIIKAFPPGLTTYAPGGASAVPLK